MKCPECGEKIYLINKEIYLHNTEYTPKANGIGFVKKPLRKTRECANGTGYPFWLFCKNCSYEKSFEDKLSEEEKELLNWVDKNMM